MTVTTVAFPATLITALCLLGLIMFGREINSSFLHVDIVLVSTVIITELCVLSEFYKYVIYTTVNFHISTN